MTERRLGALVVVETCCLWDILLHLPWPRWTVGISTKACASCFEPSKRRKRTEGEHWKPTWTLSVERRAGSVCSGSERKGASSAAGCSELKCADIGLVCAGSFRPRVVVMKRSKAVHSERFVEGTFKW